MYIHTLTFNHATCLGDLAVKLRTAYKRNENMHSLFTLCFYDEQYVFLTVWYFCKCYEKKKKPSAVALLNFTSNFPLRFSSTAFF